VRIAVTLLALAACGKSPSDAPVAGSGSAAPKPALRAIAKLSSPTLVAGSRRIAITTGEDWLESAPGGPRNAPAIAAHIARLRASLGGDFEVFLGTHPIVVAGEEHHEQYLRITPEPRAIALDGHLVRVAAVRSGDELWQLEERLRDQLAIVDASGTLTPVPPYELIGSPITGISPVSARKCSTPQIVELASTGIAIAALIVECNPDSPIRIATYRWPGAASVVERLASATELGFEPKHLVVSPNGTLVLVGAAGGKLVVARVASDRKVTQRSSLEHVTRVVEAALADDGSVWTMTIGRDDAWQLARDGELVTIADPSGTLLRPKQLAFDQVFGVVVIASSAAESWLLVER